MVASFTFPSGPDYSQNFTAGQKVVITWQDATEYTELSLGLGQVDDPSQGMPSVGLITWMISNDLSFSAQNYAWTVTTQGLNVSAGNSYALVLVNGTNFGLPASSPIFRIVDDNSHVSSSISSSSSSISSTSSKTATISSTLLTSSISSILASSPTIASLAPSSTSLTPSASQSVSSGLSSSAKAGIGISLSLSFIISVIVIWFLWKRKRTKRLQPGRNNTVAAAELFEWKERSPPQYQTYGQKHGHIVEVTHPDQVYEVL